jgi:hypothetical protein
MIYLLLFPAFVLPAAPPAAGVINDVLSFPLCGYRFFNGISVAAARP